MTSGTPGDVDEFGTKVIHAFNAIVEVLHTGQGFGRKVLEGEGRVAGPLGVCDHLLNMHIDGASWKARVFDEVPRSIIFKLLLGKEGGC